MEVHHHSQIHHHTKKWKEYLLEFLMIFLAVTLGFVAENLREHLTERAKERQYIDAFIRNLKDDTVSLRHVIQSGRQQVSGIDTLLKLAHADMVVDSNRKSFYYYITKYCYNSAIFKSNDATLQQLKSTGDYRLIEKDHVADSLSKFDNELQNVYGQGEYYEVYFREILSGNDELADITVLGDTSFVKAGKMTNKPFPKLRGDNNKLTTFFNKVFIFKTITKSYIENNLEPQLNESKRLIEFLKSKYNMED